MNTYTRKESRTKTTSSSDIELRFSDEAVGKIAPSLVYLLTGKLAPVDVDGIDDGYRERQPTLQLPPTSDDLRDIDPPEENAPHVEEVKYGDQEAAEYFTVEGEFLHPRLKDFKGATKKEQQERFTLLYGWAYPQLLNKMVPDAAHFTKAAKKVKVYERANYAKYRDGILTQYFTEKDAGYEPSDHVPDAVKEIIAEMQDKKKEGAKYWEATATKRTRASLSEEDRELVSSLVAQKIEKEFKILSLSTARDYALVALYDITKRLKGVDKVKPIVAYEYLKGRYTQINVKKVTFTNLLRRGDKKKHFGNTEGHYFLMEDGEKLVTSWMKEGRKPTEG